eukprot:TRINITY_DN4710_c0_g1_i8.p1 TRINITY_DN4710_c0_g1~~TRINITY_DN4710_c0_g1_i8.p1  ORF type:complete len:190 (-),score=54.69 TRINITY_DN4710_c0_g1_i8:146-715(-)
MRAAETVALETRTSELEASLAQLQHQFNDERHMLLNESETQQAKLADSAFTTGQLEASFAKLEHSCEEQRLQLIESQNCKVDLEVSELRAGQLETSIAKLKHSFDEQLKEQELQAAETAALKTRESELEVSLAQLQHQFNDERHMLLNESETQQAKRIHDWSAGGILCKAGTLMRRATLTIDRTPELQG